jgi:methylenetetrahydrofolate/methylenetetrahydromethanopterin dehydrogenase (NADP+)
MVQIPRLLQGLRRLQRRYLSRTRRWWCFPVPDPSDYVPRRFSPRKARQVTLTSRDKQRAAAACQLIQARFGVSPIPLAAADNDARGATIRGADIVFAAGGIGVKLLEERHWRDERTIELIADCNAQPPLGVGGIDATDKGNTRHQKLVFGALGIGGLKLKLHRACVAQLFQCSDQVLDAEEIYALAKTMT